MRLEIIIPDTTRADRKAKLTKLTRQLSKNPELVDNIHLNGGSEDVAIQKLFTPELLAEIDAAGADLKAGNFRTQEQVDATLAATRARWLAENRS